MRQIAQAIAMIKPFYEREPSGGVLHVALDDGNMDDGCVKWCLEEAKKEGDEQAVEIAEFLLSMPEDDRFDLYDNYDDYS